MASKSLTVSLLRAQPQLWGEVRECFVIVHSNVELNADILLYSWKKGIRLCLGAKIV